MSTVTELPTSKELAALVAEYVGSPENWPAAMAARTLRVVGGRPAYSGSNQALIMAQIAGRSFGDNLTEEQHFAALLDAVAGEIAPRSVWVSRGFTPRGAAVCIWSKPFQLWVDEKGERVAPRTEGARQKTVFRGEQTYLARDVKNADGESGEMFSPDIPEMTVPEAVVVWERLTSWIELQGWKVRRVASADRANGWTVHANKSITVQAGLDGWAAVETLSHEIAHAILHGDNDAREYTGEHRGEIEAEAESVAFAVLMMLGQTELAKGSVRYIADWNDRKPAVIAAAYERACHVTDALARVILGEQDVTVAASSKAEKLQAKAGNKALAQQLRDAGIEPRGEAWARAKAGEPIELLMELAKAA